LLTKSIDEIEDKGEEKSARLKKFLDSLPQVVYDSVSGLLYLHQTLKAIHGDMKLENMFVVPKTDPRTFVVADLGDAFPISMPELVGTGTNPLQPEEQLICAEEKNLDFCRKVTPAIDYYSLGTSILFTFLKMKNNLSSWDAAKNYKDYKSFESICNGEVKVDPEVVNVVVPLMCGIPAGIKASPESEAKLIEDLLGDGFFGGVRK